jgi:hypothetical protein
MRLFDRWTAGRGVQITDFQIASRSITGPIPVGTDDNGLVVDRFGIGPRAALSPDRCGVTFGGARHDDLGWAR